jgi:predicted Zn finger-like uncharacterized protein
MILTCPSCGTQYVVKDGAIPPEGRQVRCASCKHSWHQDPEEGAAEAEPAAAEAPVEAVTQEAAAELEPERAEDDESLAEATLIEPRSGPEAEERAYEESALEETAPAAEPEGEFVPYAQADDAEFVPYAQADDHQEEPRRRSPLITVLIVILLVVIAAAAFWFLAPVDLKAKLGLVAAASSPLELLTTHMDRQRLESGNELLTVSGRVINPTAKEQNVPPLQAQLRSRGGKLVYSWTIAPPAPSLSPGASAPFNSAEVNVPPGGDELTITVGPAHS